MKVKLRQEALLLQGYRATRYVSKSRRAMLHEVWELERFQTAKVTFKAIQGH